MEKDNNKEVKDLVVDIEEVKNAIQVCINFEKVKGISLINPKGRKQFSEIYRKEEPRRNFERIIDEKIDKKLEPMNQKMDMLLTLMKTNIEKAVETDIDNMKIATKNNEQININK